MTWRPDRSAEAPRPIGESLQRVARRLGTDPAMSAVWLRWEELVGPAVAAHAYPVSTSGSTLVIGVDEPAWATQLRLLSGDLLARIGEVVGEGSVERIEVRVRPPKPPRSGVDPA